MSFTRKKDKKKLFAFRKIMVGHRYYFQVYLWEDQESFDVNTADTEPGECAGVCNTAPYLLVKTNDGRFHNDVNPKLMEVHIIKDKWTLEIVVHELLHALFHKIRAIGPVFGDVIYQSPDIQMEEEVCYEYGQWVDTIYSWLWDVNPWGKHSKKK